MAERKKKILYPIGTEVMIRDSMFAELYRQDRVNHDSKAGKRVVLNYIKGDDRPYVVSCADSSVQSAVRFSVEELQRYKAVDSHPQGTATEANCQAPVKSISTDEVVKIVANEVALAEASIMEEMKSNQFELMQQLTTVQTTIGILARELEEARRENADNQVTEDQ